MGKTREQTQSTQIDPDLKEQSLKALDRAWAASEIPFMPNRGVRVADFSPDQYAAFGNNNAASNAFGLGQGGQMSMPTVETVDGIRGYSTGNIYDDAVNKSVPQPIQDYMAGMFIDPMTGQMTNAQQAQVAPPTQTANNSGYNAINPYWNGAEGGYNNPGPDGGGVFGGSSWG